MQHLSTAFLLISVVIVVNQGSGVTAKDDELLAIESQKKAIATMSSPKHVPQTKPSNQSLTKPDLSSQKPEQRPPSKPPNVLPDAVKLNHHFDVPRYYYGHRQKLSLPRAYPKQPILPQYSPNSLYKYPRVIPPRPQHRPYYTHQTRPLMYVMSTVTPINNAKSHQFNLPVQVINGNRTDIVMPPASFNKTSSTTSTTTATTTTAITTTTTTTTTQKYLRTKRIWPKRIINKLNLTLSNTTFTKDITNKMNKTNDTDYEASESYRRVTFTSRNATPETTTTRPSTTRVYRPVTRKIKVKTSTYFPPINSPNRDHDDWVPMLPSHYAKLRKTRSLPDNSKRSDILAFDPSAPSDNQEMFLQSFGIVALKNPKHSDPPADRKNVVMFKKKRPLKPHSSGYSRRPGRSPTHVHHIHGNLANHIKAHSKDKIKHHHHHHHHRYIKTVEKPVKVPFKVEVPKPYPVEVEKKVEVPVEKVKVVEKPVPYPVTVEKKVPYPIGIKIPHPVPVKVVEKEYVPQPYPVIQKVPVVKHVHVKVPQPFPVPFEKKVPYPVHVRIPVAIDRPVPVPVPVEKKVPYPVPVKVLVPKPYAVEKKVPYPVEIKVKEPIEVVRHVPIKVPYPQPYAVKIPQPIPIHIEKKVPYPVEKQVRVPVKVLVPHTVQVEKKVPVFIPKPYPVEKRVPFAVKVPYPIRVPVRIPVKVPVEVPVYIHQPVQLQMYGESDEQYASSPGYDQYASSPGYDQYASSPGYKQDYDTITPHTVTIQGSSYKRLQSRSDSSETTTAITDREASESYRRVKFTSRTSTPETMTTRPSTTRVPPCHSSSTHCDHTD